MLVERICWIHDAEKHDGDECCLVTAYISVGVLLKVFINRGKFCWRFWDLVIEVEKRLSTKGTSLEAA